LVIHGDSDGLVPVAVAEEFARLIPDARLVRVEAAGHLPMLEQADVFVDAVEKFVAG
jgi:pimeloyl-ACP methyl ester carboxylesterase